MENQKNGARNGDENFDMPSDKALTYKEVITQRLNQWRVKHVERVSMYMDAVERRKADPTAMIIVGFNQHTGQNLEKSISTIVEERLPAAIESKYKVEALERLLEEAEKGDESTGEFMSAQLELPNDLMRRSPIDLSGKSEK
jgi:hypothetical protein